MLQSVESRIDIILVGSEFSMAEMRGEVPVIWYISYMNARMVLVIMLPEIREACGLEKTIVRAISTQVVLDHGFMQLAPVPREHGFGGARRCVAAVDGAPHAGVKLNLTAPHTHLTAPHAHGNWSLRSSRWSLRTAAGGG